MTATPRCDAGALPAPKTAGRPTALLVIAAPWCREALVEALQWCGFDVMAANGHAPVLDCLERLRPQLLVTDLDGQDGTALLLLEAVQRRLGSQAPGAVVVSSRRPDAATTERLAAAGCHGWLPRIAPLVDVASAAREALHPQSANARRHRRIALPLPTRVGRGQRASFAMTTDISLGGAFVRCDDPPAAGERVTVQLALPADGTLRLTAEVRHVRTRLDDPLWPAGFGVRFEGLALADSAALRSALGLASTPAD